MSTKAKKAAPKAKATEKVAKAAAPAKAGKAAKGAKSAPIEDEIELSTAPSEAAREEAEEEEEAAAVSSSNSGGNAAALAAVTGSTEMSASFKNFRHHPDMENFYRFIYENDLRLEALAIIDEMMVERVNRKTVKMAKANAH